MTGFRVVSFLFSIGFALTNGFVSNNNPTSKLSCNVGLFQSQLDADTEDQMLDVVINGVPDSEEILADRPVINGYSMPTDKKSLGYSAYLDRKRLFPWSPKLDNTGEVEDEDGYVDMKGKRSTFGRMIRKPFNAISSRLGGKKAVEPGTLILVRHGESEWNKNKTFTGWADPDLTEQGKREMEHAARLLMEGGFEIDIVFTSRLTRAIRSCWILLQEFNQVYVPVFKSWVGIFVCSIRFLLQYGNVL